MATAPDPGCKYVIGIDVGSTTVKMAVVDPTTLEIVWSKYLRHETRQPEMTREMLADIHAAFPDLRYEVRAPTLDDLFLALSHEDRA